MKGDEAVLVPAAAFMNKSEIWLEEGETAAVDHAAIDEWVGVLKPDDQVSMSECTLLGKKSGILSASVESSVRSSISSSASMICVSTVDERVGTLLVVVVAAVVVVVVVCDFFVGDLYETIDTFSTNTGSFELVLLFLTLLIL
jgi:hypothetical protein